MPPTAWYSDKLRTSRPDVQQQRLLLAYGMQIQRPAVECLQRCGADVLRQRGLAKIIHRRAHRRANQQPHRQLAQPAPDFTGHGLSPAALSPAPRVFSRDRAGHHLIADYGRRGALNIQHLRQNQVHLQRIHGLVIDIYTIGGGFLLRGGDTGVIVIAFFAISR